MRVLAISVNAVAARGSNADGILVYESGQQIFIKHTDLEGWNLRLPESDAFTRDGLAYVALNSISGLRYTINEETQEMQIVVPGSSFIANRATYGGNASLDTSKEMGGFLNYDLTAEYSGRPSVSGLLELGTFGKWGLLTNRFVRSNANGAGLVRLETTLTYDFPGKIQSIRAGDSTIAPGAWGRAIYFGGFQWRTDFGTNPEYVTFPTPTVHGEAIAPSVADVYVNNARVASQKVNAGPFDITNAPLPSGPGQVTLIVTDLLGRSQTISQSYFSSPKLLRKNLVDFSVSIGKIRKGYGYEWNNYGRSIASGSYRRGLTDILTAEVRSELSSHLQAAGITGSLILMPHVTGSVGLIGSNSQGLKGKMLTGSLEYQGRKISGGVQAKRADTTFRQLGLDQEFLPSRLEGGIFVGFSTFGRDHITGSYFVQDSPVTPLRYASGSYSLGLGRRMFWSTSLTKAFTGVRQTTFTAGLTFQIGERTNLLPSFTREGDKSKEQVLIQRNLPLGPGIGYQAILEHGNPSRGDIALTARTNTNEFQGEISRASTGTGYRAGVQGAFGWVRKRVFRTRRIDDSFAVVKVGDIAGVHVLSENQRVAVTDSRGIAIVPRLLSYQSNHIGIDFGDLPANTTIDRVERDVRPGRRTSASVNFEVEFKTGILVRLVDGSGEAIPFGAIVSVGDKANEFPIGVNGVVYLIGFPLTELTLQVRWEKNACNAALVFASEPESGQTFTCASK